MLVKWIDNLYTYEGSLLINFGKEGELALQRAAPAHLERLYLDQVNENTNYDSVTQVSCYASGNVPCWFTDETFPGAQCAAWATKPLRSWRPTPTSRLGCSTSPSRKRKKCLPSG